MNAAKIPRTDQGEAGRINNEINNEWREAAYLVALAAAHAEAGEQDRAVEWQEKANTLNADKDDGLKGKERLTLHEVGGKQGAVDGCRPPARALTNSA